MIIGAFLFGLALGITLTVAGFIEFMGRILD